MDLICKLVSAVVAYDHATTGDVYMIVIHQAVLVPGMKVNLLGQMQVKDNDVIVNDKPKYMALTPTDNTHAITLKDKEGEIALRIPLSLHGVTSYFTTRKPTQEEYDKTELSSILDLTYESPDWDPTSIRFQEQEDATLHMSMHCRRPPSTTQNQTLTQNLELLSKAGNSNVQRRLRRE